MAYSQLGYPCAPISTVAQGIGNMSQSASSATSVLQKPTDSPTSGNFQTAGEGNTTTLSNLYQYYYGLGLLGYGSTARPDLMYPGYGTTQSSPTAFDTSAYAQKADLKSKAITSMSTYPAYHPYYSTMAGYPYGAGYGGQLAPPTQTKTYVSRENTQTLKAWLYEHLKNPYPTKGEKIMLAIISKMTLTQVSTWFANARRRLKKENKMTWTPRNRPGYPGDDDDEDDDKDVDDDDDDDSLNNETKAISEQTTSPVADDRLKPPTDDNGNIGHLSTPLQIKNPFHGSAHIDSLSPNNNASQNFSFNQNQSPNPSHKLSDCMQDRGQTTTSPKPKIWSIAHVATSESNTSDIESDAQIFRRHPSAVAF